MARKLLTALAALVVAGAIVVVAIVWTDWRTKSELRRDEFRRKQATTKSPVVAPDPTSPPAIDPAVVQQIFAVGEPRPPKGTKEDYTWQQIEVTLDELRQERQNRPQAQEDLENWSMYLANPKFTASQDIAEHLTKLSSWRQELPDSSTPLVVMAEALNWAERLVDFDEECRPWATAFQPGGTAGARPLVRFAADGLSWDIIIPDLGNHGHACAIAPDRTLLAVAELNARGAEGIRIWDLRTGKMRKRLSGHWNHIGSLTFSSDSKRLASIALMGGVIKIWSLDEIAER